MRLRDLVREVVQVLQQKLNEIGLLSDLDSGFHGAIALDPGATALERLTALYEKHNPAKLDEVEGTLMHYTRTLYTIRYTPHAILTHYTHTL
jgi:hypothetical protein